MEYTWLNILHPSRALAARSAAIAEAAAPPYDLRLVESLTCCRPVVTVLVLKQYGDARCGPPTAGDWSLPKPGLAKDTATIYLFS